MDVILSIKPEYCRKILTGEKKYEFRKRIFKHKDSVHRIFMYSTSPVQKLVGAFTIEAVIEDSPDNLWERFKESAGVEKESFFKYFGTLKKGFAIKIGRIEEFVPIDPRNFIPDFSPPQSFRYVESTKWIESLKNI